MKTFEELFRASSQSPEYIVNDLLVKAENGEYWHGQTRVKYEWFKVGQAQNLAMLRKMHDLLETVPSMSHVEGFGKLLADVEEVLNNEKA